MNREPWANLTVVSNFAGWTIKSYFRFCCALAQKNYHKTPTVVSSFAGWTIKLIRTTIKLLKFVHPKNCCNEPKSCTRWFYLRVMRPNDAERIANNVDPDLGCTVCPGLSVRKLRIITAIFFRSAAVFEIHKCWVIAYHMVTCTCNIQKLLCLYVNVLSYSIQN